MFRNISGGLIAKGAERTGFTMAGSNGKILPAKAVIDGGTVVVTSEKMIKPETVRWGRAHVAVMNLLNQAGLPAVSFHSDAR
jgi:sialate O-acetylesterase